MLLSTLYQRSFIKTLQIIAVEVHGVVGAGPVGWTLVRRGWGGALFDTGFECLFHRLGQSL